MRVLSAAATVGLAVLLAGCGNATEPWSRTVPHAVGCRDQQVPGMAWAGPGALTGVQFVSPQRGWVVGVDEILATIDGGRHWTVQLKGHLRLPPVPFLHPTPAWAVAAPSPLP